MTAVTTYAPGPSGSTAALHAIWQSTVGAIHPAYALPAAQLHTLLTFPSARVFVVRCHGSEGSEDSESGVIGWALTYLIRSGSTADATGQHLRGGLAALVVDPEHQRRGIGRALHSAAVSYLSDAVRASFDASSPPAKQGILQLGSVFPRLWPGMPSLPGFQGARRFFEAEGWKFADTQCIDLYGALPAQVDLEGFITPAREKGVGFRPATSADRDEVVAFEYSEFPSGSGWADMFPTFFDAGCADDLHLALKDGKVIGATLAAMPGSPAHTRLAWPAALGQACGVVACVGVGSHARGLGAGLGLVAAAIADLQRRGADGVFIDWVNMEAFYERFGVKQWEAAYIDASIVVT